MAIVFSDEELAGICVGCGGDATIVDALSLEWCPDCKQRGDLVNWGASHGWRALDIHPYAIAEGAYFYQIAAACGNDEMIWLMIGLIEMLENEQEVA